MTGTDQIFAAAFAVMGLVLVYVIAIATATGILGAECLRHGYPRAEVTWNFEQYCTKRVDQTDVVVPIEAVRRGR